VNVAIRGILPESEVTFGYVSEAQNQDEFRVAGQRVDARGAQRVGFDGAPLADALYVLVQGTMADGVLVAQRIERLPD
jgi:hypothetical protein